MINLNDFTVEIEGKKYIPLEVAAAAVAEAYGDVKKLDEAMKLIQDSVNDINKAFDD
jgi:hypothetical protein